MALVTLVLMLGFLGVGGALAFAGRELYHFVILAFGFLLGFVPGVLAVIPFATDAWFSGGLLEFLFVGGGGLAVAVMIGAFVARLVWAVYIFTIALPGLLIGGSLGLTIAAPIGSPLLGVVIVAVLALGAGIVSVMLHELLLVPLTALLGGVFVGLGIYVSRLGQLTVVQEPARLLSDPGALVAEVFALGGLFTIVVALVFVLGCAVQFARGEPAAE